MLSSRAEAAAHLRPIPHARASGDHCIVVSHKPELGYTYVKLPSGNTKKLRSTCRGVVGIVAGGGRVEKPVLKAGNSYYRFRVKRNCWPKARPSAVVISHRHRDGIRWSDRRLAVGVACLFSGASGRIFTRPPPASKSPTWIYA